MAKRKVFTREFKREAVRLLDLDDKPAAQLARELGIRRNQLYKWKEEIDKRGKEAFPGKGRRPSKESQLAENERLKRELAKVKEENEILKKAAAFFAKELS
jgi:transposase-like protein